MTQNRPRRVLVCGHRAFAAQGIVAALEAAGHEVVCFSRGKVRIEGNVVTGPVAGIAENPHLARPFDTVINYILLKDRGIEDNLAYLGALLRFCQERGVQHLMHLSSVSVYRGGTRTVDERSRVETDPSRKGSYGALKVATDRFLRRRARGAPKITLLRPGFILGGGLTSPIVGMAFRVPWNRLLLLGDARNTVPLTHRDLVHRALVRLVADPPRQPCEALLLVDPASPTRREYLEVCCRRLGCGVRVTTVPVVLWLIAGALGEGIARTLRMRLRVYRLIASACRRQRFDPALTQRRLRMDLSLDWPAALADSLPGQRPNVALPYRRVRWGRLAARRVVYIGFGRVVKQRHLPALKRLEYRGTIEAYDLRGYQDPTGHTVRALDEHIVEGDGLVVVASPGPAHVRAIGGLLRATGPVLVEKPLCCTREDLARWVEFARGREAATLVCHNYRFKRNVRRMMAHLARYNPGRLLHVHVAFQSPPVANERAAWLRDERRARTLLLDYGIHFLDVACMFSSGVWRAANVSHRLDHAGRTSLIAGDLAGDAYRVSFLLRQGFIPRRARVFFTFQNYGVSLGFFPETFVAHMTDDNPSLHLMEACPSARATAGKIADRLLGRDSDRSHQAVYLAADGRDPVLARALSVGSLQGFYEGLFDVAEAVYGRCDGEGGPP